MVTKEERLKQQQKELEAKTPNDKMIKFYSKGVTELRAMLVEYQEGLEYWKERANEYNKLRNIKK